MTTRWIPAALALLGLSMTACDSSPSAPACRGPIHVGELDIIPPVKLHAPNPQYTEVARKARIQGTVIVECVVDCNGIPVNLRILKGLPMGLNETTLDAVSRWRFQPAMLDGRPVSVWYNLTVNFRLQ